MKVYRLTDRIPVKIDGVTFMVAPLSFEQKAEILGCKKIVKGEETEDHAKMVWLSIKYSVKSVTGLQNQDGSEYVIELVDNSLSDATISELLSLPIQGKLATACANLMNGVSKYDIEGVEIDLDNVQSVKKS
jgi:hypothetical protein